MRRLKLPEGHIPKCIYCRGSMPAYAKGTPHEGRGRRGEGAWCSLACCEEWARRQYFGESKPRGKSHSRGGKVG